jgi:hypothetical protein
MVHLEESNKRAAVDGYPNMKTAPLPACAQFLNVIESVFSGMSRAIIHNSDYPSLGLQRTLSTGTSANGTPTLLQIPDARAAKSGEANGFLASSVRAKTAKIRAIVSA